MYFWNEVKKTTLMIWYTGALRFKKNTTSWNGENMTHQHYILYPIISNNEKNILSWEADRGLAAGLVLTSRNQLFLLRGIVNHWSACGACLKFFTLLFVRAPQGEALWIRINPPLTFRRPVFQGDLILCWSALGLLLLNWSSETLARLSPVLGNYRTATASAHKHVYSRTTKTLII